MSNHLAVLDEAVAGAPIDARRIVDLARCNDLTLLAAAAARVRQRINPGDTVTYVAGRNVNYTNVCWVRCRFCAFYRTPGAEDGYVLSHDELLNKIQEMVDAGGTEVLLQGGLNPRLHVEWFEELFRAVKERFAGRLVTLHALSPAEVIYIAKISGITLLECLSRLRRAGLDSIPGGGAEILTDRVRAAIAPLKASAEAWLNCMGEAHRLGIRTTATMMYGSVDTWEDRAEHLVAIRRQQELTAGFTAFIPWPYQPGGSVLGGKRTGAFEYLKTVAISRLALQNVPHLQASWVTVGPRVAQIALDYGVDDFGSTMMEENVVSSAGCSFLMAPDEIARTIREAGWAPVRRLTDYTRAELEPKV